LAIILLLIDKREYLNQLYSSKLMGLSCNINVATVIARSLSARWIDSAMKQSDGLSFRTHVRNLKLFVPKISPFGRNDRTLFVFPIPRNRFCHSERRWGILTDCFAGSEVAIEEGGIQGTVMFTLSRANVFAMTV